MKHSSKPKVIIILGPPGSGKGSQGLLLSEKLSLYCLETSKILEEKFKTAKASDFILVRGKKYFIKEEERLRNSGFLCSPPFVFYLLKDKIKSLYKEGKGIILVGSPRTLLEAKEGISLLKKLYGLENVKVFLLEVSPKETIFRNSHRRICELMRHSILYFRENAQLKKCPLDGSKLIIRKNLDDPEVIKVRIKEYKERTMPLIDYFIKQGLEVIKMNGSLSPVDVFNNILKRIDF